MRNAATETLLSAVASTGMSLTEDAYAEYMDVSDPLRESRSAYNIPSMRDGTPFAYLASSNLGLQHVGVEASINGFMRKWRDQACEGNVMAPNPWLEIDQLCQKDMASLVGAQVNEVVVMNSFTVNLHLLVFAFYRPSGSRKKIMMEQRSFSGSRFCIASQLETRGMDPVEDLVVVTTTAAENSTGPVTVVPTDAFLAAIEKRGDETALLVLPAIHYLTGQLVDIATIVKAAHAKNIMVGVDCSHAVGNVPLRLHDWEVDFACWSTYKYLSGGPGNVGAAFVHSKPISGSTGLKYLKGWWGNDIKTRFTPHHTFEPTGGAMSLQLSTPPAANMMILAPAVKLMASVGMEALRQKSLLLTAYLELLLNELIPPGCIEILTPADPNQRGAQLSFRILPNKLKVDDSLSASASQSVTTYEYGAGNSGGDGALLQRQALETGVMVDRVSPDIIRLAPAPIYNSFTDVLRTVRSLSSMF